MNKKASLVGVILLFILFSSISLSYAVCTPDNTPRIIPADYFELSEGEPFIYDYNLFNLQEPDITYTFHFLDNELEGIEITSKGILHATPTDNDAGTSRIAIIAFSDACADSIITTLKIFDRPEVTFFSPENTTIQLNQTEVIDFEIKAFDRDENETLEYEWFIDKKPINDAINKTDYTFTPGYGLSGVYEISAKVTDSRNLSTEQKWYVQISKVNRAPIFLSEIPNFMVFRNTASGAYNLNDYFSDPDRGYLRFEYEQVRPSFEIKEVVFANISVHLPEDGFVSYDPRLNTKGYTYFKFIAYDILNLSAESNIVKVDIAGADQFRDLRNGSSTAFCGDHVCSMVEDCKTCPFDCGMCKQDDQAGCKPDWDCTDWGPCLPSNFTLRNCTDKMNCGDNRTKPDEVKRCKYTARCDDGLKNGIEEGVDCGGPCETVCPTCDDNIQNQGEEGVDCGGPCEKICPGCDDEIKNQNESDIDCGGPCPGCDGDKSCLKSTDCKSFRCEYLVCTFASCDDEIKNQDEEGVDCGGVCPDLCGNCSDEIMNQGEKGVDCGGRCIPCPNCEDGYKNGNEKLTDCGGECRKCELNDYLQGYALISIIIIGILVLIPIGFFSYFVIILMNPEKARRIYDSAAGFTFLVSMNKFFRGTRRITKKKPVLSNEVVRGFINELNEIGKLPNVDDKALYQRIIRIYTAILGLPEQFDNAIFGLKLRASSTPMFMKILLIGYFKKIEILAADTFVAQEQKADMIIELKFLLAELSKG